MTANKESPEVVEFMLLFQRLKDWSDNEPEALPELASTDESIKDLCLKLLEAAGSLQRNERGDRDLFTAPVDSKFISTWRDFEERFADVLLTVLSNAVEAGDVDLTFSFNWYQRPRWEDADRKAAGAAELTEKMINGEILEAMINFMHSQADGDMTGASTTETLDRTPVNIDAWPKEIKEPIVEAYAFRNELVEQIQLCDDEARKSELNNKLIELARMGIADYGLPIDDVLKCAKTH
jgi:hypothetical protein